MEYVIIGVLVVLFLAAKADKTAPANGSTLPLPVSAPARPIQNFIPVQRSTILSVPPPLAIVQNPNPVQVNQLPSGLIPSGNVPPSLNNSGGVLTINNPSYTVPVQSRPAFVPAPAWYENLGDGTYIKHFYASADPATDVKISQAQYLQETGNASAPPITGSSISGVFLQPGLIDYSSSPANPAPGLTIDKSPAQTGTIVQGPSSDQVFPVYGQQRISGEWLPIDQQTSVLGAQDSSNIIPGRGGY